MKRVSVLAFVLLAVVGSVSAVRYQPYAIHRIYYTDASKQVAVGTGLLHCPSYSDLGWIYDGQVTAYYREYQGQECAVGGATGPWCPAGSDPLLCT